MPLVLRALLHSLQFLPIPLPEISPRLIRALQKFQQCLSWRSSATHIVVHQQKLFHHRMVKSRVRLHFLTTKTSRLRRGVCIKCRAFDIAAARPQSRADHLMRIRLARNRIGSRTLRSPTTRKTRHAQVEAPPEKMHRTILADKACPEFLEDRVAQYQYLPEAVRIFAIV